MRMLQPQTPKEPDGQSSSFDINVSRSFRRRPVLGLGIFLAVVAVGVPYALARSASRYLSEVSIYVSPTFTKNLVGEQQDFAQYTTFITQQMAVLTRYDVVAAAAKRTEGTAYRWRTATETERESVERLRKALKVSHVPDTYLISVSLEGQKREGVADLLNGLAAIAIENAAKETFFGRGDRVNALTHEKANLEAALAIKSEELSRLSGALGMVSIDKGLNPDDRMLTNSRADLDDARKHRLEAETQLEMLAGKNGSSTPALSAIVDEKLATDTSLNGTISALNRKATELQTSVLGMSVNHPLRKAADQQSKEIEEQLAAVRNTARRQAEVQILDKVRGDLSRARSVETQLDAQVRDRLGRVAGESRDMQGAASLQLEIDQDRIRLNAVDERIDYLSVESAAPGPLRIFSAAQTPLNPIPGSRKKMFLMIFAGALFVSFVIIIGIDLFDPKLRETGCVEQILGFSPTGLILEKRSFSADFAAEHFSRLVAGIERARQNFKTRTFVFSSLMPGGGSSTLTEDIGKELKAHDLRVLRIEANAFGPDAREQDHGMPGLVDILESQYQWKDAIRAGKSGSPDWIPLGYTKGRPRLPGFHHLEALLQQVASIYDVVLIDAAPLLLSADTEAIIGLAGATMLVVQANCDTKKNLKRANQLLKRLEPAAVGCVLNRVELSRGGEALRQEFAEYREFRKIGRAPELNRAGAGARVEEMDPSATTKTLVAANASIASSEVHLDRLSLR